jgi:hypothetical protein
MIARQKRYIWFDTGFGVSHRVLTFAGTDASLEDDDRPLIIYDKQPKGTMR